MQKVYTKIESIVGNVVTVKAEGVRLGDLALVGDSYATVIKLDRDIVSLQVFAGAQGVGTNDSVRFLDRPMMVSFSEHLLGRVFDGAGVPRDHGPALTDKPQCNGFQLAVALIAPKTTQRVFRFLTV